MQERRTKERVASWLERSQEGIRSDRGAPLVEPRATWHHSDDTSAVLKTTFIQRLRTSGGIAPPAAACSQPAHVGARALIPYTADYIFLRGGVNN